MFFFFSRRRRHTRFKCDWSSDVCSSDLPQTASASVSITVGGIVGAPNLVFTKSGPATMRLGQWGQFGLNVQNTGTSEAWNATLLDQLPSGATGGMCSTTPQVLSAQVFQADGVTPVAGKGPLVPGTDF